MQNTVYVQKNNHGWVAGRKIHLRQLLGGVLDAQHFNNLANDSVNQKVIRVHNKLTRPLDSANTANIWVLIKLVGLLHEQIAKFDRS